MDNKEYISISQAAELLGITRQAVHKRIKNGKLKAVKIGRAYAIPVKNVVSKMHKSLREEDKERIKKVIARVVKEYGEALRLLGNE
jgi:excisionase family DNA binding protein